VIWHSRSLLYPTAFLIVALSPACTDSSRAAERLPGRNSPPAALADAAADPTITGAGDIASCVSSGDERTAKLLDNIKGPIFTAGDNVYRTDGVEQPFAECYDKSWGRHRSRTHPVPGNHEYEDSEIDTYFDYFGRSAGERGKGYYSYQLGQWHVIALNSMLDASPESPQGQWLADDIARHPSRCTLAYFHHPRFSSGPHSRRRSAVDLWAALFKGGVDVVVNGHDHIYERFGPMNADGERDNENGMREFVVGTGGDSHYDIETVAPHSEVRSDDTYGVLSLTLHRDSYDWRFIPVHERTFSDSGTGSCR
jgi:hypothetical protein